MMEIIFEVAETQERIKTSKSVLKQVPRKGDLINFFGPYLYRVNDVLWTDCYDYWQVIVYVDKLTK